MMVLMIFSKNGATIFDQPTFSILDHGAAELEVSLLAFERGNSLYYIADYARWQSGAHNVGCVQNLASAVVTVNDEEENTYLKNYVTEA